MLRAIRTWIARRNTRNHAARDLPDVRTPTEARYDAQVNATERSWFGPTVKFDANGRKQR